MKEIDDTDPPISESEGHLRAAINMLRNTIGDLEDRLHDRQVCTIDRLQDLERRIAHLETQRTPQDENDDPEWFS